MEEQEERESQKLWHDVTEAVKRRDQDAATDAKAKIEDMQRQEAAQRNSENVDWHPRLFRRVQGGRGGSDEGEEDLDWIISAKVLVSDDTTLQPLLTRYSDGKTPEEVVKQILSIHAILPGQKPDKQFNIPSRANDAPLPCTQESAPTTAQVPTEKTAQHTEQAQTGDLAQSMGQMHIGQPAQPAGQMYPVQSEAAGMQSQPAAVPQYQQQSVGLSSTYDGTTTTHAPLSKGSSSISSDPSNPPTIPYQKPVFQSHQNISPAYQDKIEQELPKSKLLNSNPAPEPRRDDLLRRTDSETREDEEFHDAVS
jgi:hypothetical protein